ncbi:MAG: DUF2851 family protein [Flavobacteriaceae bacterium]|nr:DUF2851 family protein [Flavobacteriaceae bacterium]
MQEDFLHFLWKYRKLDAPGLRTSCGQSLFIIHPGHHNKFSGPDFFNAQIRLNDQLWAGNVEIHVRASDWYAHSHECDPNYENVVLHVVWQEDLPVLNAAGYAIPTLEMRKMIRPSALESYRTLMKLRTGQFINCENQIAGVDSFLIDAWKERLFFERLVEKVSQIESLLQACNGDWDAVTFLMVLQSFGSKINKENFLEVGRRIPFYVVKKVQGDPAKMEAILFGVAGLLNEKNPVDPYYQKMHDAFEFLSHKFNVKKGTRKEVEFFKLRPMNFPTLRLSQFAAFWCDPAHNFNTLMSEYRYVSLEEMLVSTASGYWETHYLFGKESDRKPKTTSKAFIETLILNAIIPLKFAYARYRGLDRNERILELAQSLKSEKNRTVDSYTDLGITSTSALDSQALLQLYKAYCLKHRCLECSIGHFLLQDK